MDKKELGFRLERIAALLELKGENPFKVRAFANAARLITAMPDLEERITAGTLTEIKGIGGSLAEIITGLWTTGTHPAVAEIEGYFTPGLLELFEIPGLGPKKIKALHEELHIASPEELKYAVYENRLLDLPGFGKKSQDKIGAELLRLEQMRGRLLLDAALGQAEAIRRNAPALLESGELRRRMPVVSCLEFLAPPDLPVPFIMKALPGFAWSEEDGLLRGRVEGSATETLIRLGRGNVWLDLFEATGNPEHVRQIRARGSLPADPRSEEEIYSAAGLPWIPPEMREGRGEVDLAAAGGLADVVAHEDLRGCFHNHTTESDGASALEEMQSAASALGWEFLGIADHSQSARYARGLEPERLLRQVERIRALNASSAFRLFAGTESDILPDGAVDYPDDVLARLDYAVASIHSSFQLDEEKQTRRLCRALSHPAVKILGHPTGRLLLGRDGYPVDIVAVMEAARQYGKAIEINANPHRLDLDWTRLERAQALGIPICINPDAHEASHLTDVRYGVWAARKGLLRTENCMNTWNVERVAEFFGRNR